MDDRHDRRLRLAGYVFALGSAVHLVDHLRRGQGSVSDELYVAGNLALVMQVAVITLVVTRHRMAALAALAAGIPLALGFLTAHWLPEWSALSDPVWEIDSLRTFSYLASSLEVLGALAVGLAGLAVVRARGLVSFAPLPADDVRTAAAAQPVGPSAGRSSASSRGPSSQIDAAVQSTTSPTGTARCSQPPDVTP